MNHRYEVRPLAVDYATGAFYPGAARWLASHADDYPAAIRRALARNAADPGRPWCVVDATARKTMAFVWNLQLFEDGGDLHEYTEEPR